MIAIKVHRKGNEVLVAACDENLLGKKLAEGEVHLYVNPEFYDAQRVDRETFLTNLRIATIANLVGKEVVAIGIEEGFVDEEGVLYIEGVPHAQIFWMI